MTALTSSAMVLAVFGMVAFAQAPATKTAGDGVYTEDQSARGLALSDKLCASCHGDKLAGGDMAPTLQGQDFLSGWSDRTAADLADKIQTSMPADAAGSLTPQQVADLMAYLFKLSGFPAGSTELAPGPALAQIRIRAK
jgi:mono/diheme cytochrome c family protein